MVFLPSLLPHRYDFIEIRDGDSEAADLLGKHCGNIAPPTIISSGSSLYIKFTSDYARQGAGFSLRYEIYKTGQWLSQRLSEERLGLVLRASRGESFPFHPSEPLLRLLHRMKPWSLMGL